MVTAVPCYCCSRSRTAVVRPRSPIPILRTPAPKAVWAATAPHRLLAACLPAARPPAACPPEARLQGEARWAATRVAAIQLGCPRAVVHLAAQAAAVQAAAAQ